MKTITFYSYKGGSGRTMLIAATAKFLNESNKSVFLLDFDLEAPGLHHKFKVPCNKIEFDLISYFDRASKYIDASFREVTIERLVSFFSYEFSANKLDFNSRNIDKQAHLLSAGNAPESSYVERYLKINWASLFSIPEEHSNKPTKEAIIYTSGYKILMALKEIILEKYKPDYLLIDSRTGVTDIGGMALNYMADDIVMLYINNNESINGIKTLLELLYKDVASNKDSKDDRRFFFVKSRIPQKELQKYRKRQEKIDKQYKTEELDYSELDKPIKNIAYRFADNFFTLHNDSLLQLVERITYDPNFTPRDSALNIDNLKFFQSIFPDEFNESPFKCIFPPLAGDKAINGECIDIQRIIENNYNEESKLPLTDILDRIKKRHKSSVEKKANQSARVICNYLPPKYIDDAIYLKFVKNIRQSIVKIFNPKHDDLIRPIEKIPIKFKKSGLTFYNYDVLGIQMNSGLFDFSEEIYFKTETRSALLSVIKLAELKSYCIVANAKHKDQIVGLHAEFTKTGPHEIHFIETLYDKGFNQFGLIASHAAAGECTKTIEKIGCPQNIVLKNTEDELKQWLQTDETIMRKIAFCDHKIGKNIANKDENIFCSSGMIDLNYDPPIDVGLIYPSGDISWRQVIVKAITEVIKKDPEIWQSADEGKATVFKIFEEEYLHPLTLKELAENLLLDMPLSEGIDWLEEIKEHFTK